MSRLRDALAHRGPDSSGLWVSPTERVGLVHTRLSIVDLSETGNQPMSSPDGRYHLVFNGEIYNHIELREELCARGHTFLGSSDTEVLLHLLIESGPACLNRLDGMFAFALYDQLTESLLLARDPLGEKPLYVHTSPNGFAFSSEVRALVAAHIAPLDPDPTGIGLLLLRGSIPPPHTHIRNVSFLQPGTWYRIDKSARVVEKHRYWTVPFSRNNELVRDRGSAVELIRAALLESTKRRVRADVPVGAFLSGGLDSTAVCAALVATGAANLRTFTITLPGQPMDEGQAAAAIARYFGLQHVQAPLELGSNNAWLGQSLAAMDVPSIDGVNTWLVSKAVRDAGLKVACSGMGGDELFFGYPSFRTIPRWSGICGLLRPIGWAASQLPDMASHVPLPTHSARAFEAMLRGGTVAALWLAKRGLYSRREVRQLLTESAYAAVCNADACSQVDAETAADMAVPRQVSRLELTVYMHDQLLRDTDCMSMAHSLEVRLPLIAPALVTAVASVDTALLTLNPPKSLLRDAIASLVPPSLLPRTKQGFTLNWPDLAPQAPTTFSPLLTHVLVPPPARRHPAVLRPQAVPPHLVLQAIESVIRRLETLV